MHIASIYAFTAGPLLSKSLASISIIGRLYQRTWLWLSVDTRGYRFSKLPAPYKIIVVDLLSNGCIPPPTDVPFHGVVPAIGGSVNSK